MARRRSVLPRDLHNDSEDLLHDDDGSVLNYTRGSSDSDKSDIINRDDDIYSGVT